MSPKFKGRLIAVKTYRDFMKKYKLHITEIKNGKRKYKTVAQMREAIYEYETNADNIVDGFYYNVPI